ncbi:MAG: M23 family metallopeptidase [Fodinibius sp.]|nr:M23 family metallopeptidase [Fodinibius sp.]
MLKAPFKFNQRISSGFDRNRFHPILKKRVPHYGTDYAAPPGTPVLAVGDGRVSTARYSRGEGNHVKIKHNAVYETVYMHLSDFADGVDPGVRVEQGEVIGYVGSTGLATGPHLHYSLYKNERPVNSLSVDLPSSESVPDSLMADFIKVRDSLNARLYEGIQKSEPNDQAITQTRAK